MTEKQRKAIETLMTAVAEALIDNAILEPHASRIRQANERLFAVVNGPDET